MLYIIWGGLTLPVLLAGMVLHFKLKEWGKKEWNILPKCLSTWMVVCTAVLGLWIRGNGRGLEKGWIVAVLVLFLIADGLLELSFPCGMAAFAAGHLILIGWFLTRGAYSTVSLVLWPVFVGLSLLLFRKEFQEGKKNPQLYLMILYPTVLMGMTAQAVILPWKLGSDYLCAAVGAVLFSISDMMVGKSFFHKNSKPVDYLALSLYYVGIFCFARIVWL